MNAINATPGIETGAAAEQPQQLVNGFDHSAETVDLDEAGRFLAMLDPDAASFTFQTFDDVKGRKRLDLAGVYHGALADLAPALVRLNQQGAGIFVTVNATDLKGREAGNIVRARAAWQDDDAGHGWDVPDLTPSIVVNTSTGKYQRYLLADGLTLEEHAAALEVMVQKHGCDKGAKGANRVLRLPGFFHMKVLDNPHLVRIVEATGKRYGRAEIVAALPPIPRPDNRRTNADLKAKFKLLDDAEIAKVKSAAEHLHRATNGKEFEERATWLEWGQALHHAAGGNEQGFALWCELSDRYCPKKYDLKDQRTRWDSFKGGSGKPLTLATIYWRATQHGWTGGWPEIVAVERRIRKGNTVETVELRVPRGKSRANVEWFLQQAGVAVYLDQFRRRYVIEGLDGHTELDRPARRALWFKAMATGLRSEKEFFHEAVMDIAQSNARHPAREYFDQVQAAWDGKPRIATWLADYAGADGSEYTSWAGKLFLVAAVRRARQPGVKFDSMLTLVGKQELGKSYLGDQLVPVPSWFTSSLALGADAKTTVEETAGKLIAEMNELWTGKREEEAVKSMITRRMDTARTAYKEDSADVPRQFILLGTTDKDEFLNDAAGNRRYWPIAVDKIDHVGIANIRGQLWGEAAALEASGEIERLEMPAHLRSAAKAAQQEHETRGPIYDMIAVEVQDFGGVIDMETLWGIVGLGKDKRDRRTDTQAKAIGKAIRQLGWERERVMVGGKRSYIYRKGAQDMFRFQLDHRGAVELKPLSVTGGLTNQPSVRATARV